MYEELLENAQKMLPNTTITMQQVTKTNDVVLDAFVITPKGSNVGATVYLKPDMTAEDIADMYNEAHIDSFPDIPELVGMLTTFDLAKEYLKLELINYNWNAGLLKNLAHISYEKDLAVVFYIDPGYSINGAQSSIRVSNDLYGQWDKDINELFDIALHNTCKEIQVTPLSDFFDDADIPDEVLELFVLSNKQRYKGDGVIMSKNAMDAILDELECDELICIPSSIHEWLIMPDRDGVSQLEYLTFDEIIKDVNENHVLPDEVLSDHVYFYNRDKGFYS